MQLILVCSAYLPRSRRGGGTASEYGKYLVVRLKPYLVIEESQEGDRIFSISLGELMELV